MLVWPYHESRVESHNAGKRTIQPVTNIFLKEEEAFSLVRINCWKFLSFYLLVPLVPESVSNITINSIVYVANPPDGQSGKLKLTAAWKQPRGMQHASYTRLI